MKVYRVGSWARDGQHLGFEYVTSRREAEAFRAALDLTETTAADAIEIERIDIPLTKAGVIHALRVYASHPDNG